MAHAALQVCLTRRRGQTAGGARTLASVLLLLLSILAFSRIQGPELDAFTAAATITSFTAASAMGAARVLPIFSLAAYIVAAFPAHYALGSIIAALPPPLLIFGAFRGPLGLVVFLFHLWLSLKSSGAVGRFCGAAHAAATTPIAALLCRGTTVKQPPGGKLGGAPPPALPPGLAERLAELLSEHGYRVEKRQKGA